MVLKNEIPGLIIGLDAGDVKSAMVAYSPSKHEIIGRIYDKNEICLDWLGGWQREDTLLAIEQFKSYGVLIGDSVLWACVWNGRFCERWFGETIWIPRRLVSAALCNDGKQGDKNVRRALIESFPKTGGGKEKSIGLVNNPGPLYGMSGDLWSALAVALTARIKYAELKDFLR